MKQRRPFIFPLLGVLLGTAALYAVLVWATPALVAGADNRMLPDMHTITANAALPNFKWNLLYTVLDFSQGPFLASLPAAICMLLGGVLGWYLERRRSPLAGNGTSGQGDRYLWLICGQFLAMALANCFWCHLVGWKGWAPTFAPLVSVTPVAVLSFGKPNYKKLLTGVLLGAILPVWAVQFLVTRFSGPLSLPSYAGIGLAIGLSNLAAFLLFRRLPWMNDGVPAAPVDAPIACEKPGAGFLVWTRTLGADVSELCFWGGSLSGLGVLVGGLISYLFNPNANAYGTQYPMLLASFLLSSAAAMWIWGPRFQRDGYAFTFESLLVVAPLVGAFPVWCVAIPVCLISAFVAPAVMHIAMRRTFFGRLPPCIAVQCVAAVLVILGTFLIRLFVA